MGPEGAPVGFLFLAPEVLRCMPTGKSGKNVLVPDRARRKLSALDKVTGYRLQVTVGLHYNGLCLVKL